MLIFRTNEKTLQAIIMICFGILLTEGYSQNSCSGGSYSRQMNRRLRCGIFKTLTLNAIDCQKYCTSTSNCFSVNTYQSDNGADVCELVNGSLDSITNETCFGMESGKVYNELKEITQRSEEGDVEKIIRKVLPNRWYQLGSSAFRHFKIKKTWKEANNICSANKASLASIDSERESNFVTETILKTFSDSESQFQDILKPLKYWKLNETHKDIVLHGKVSYVKDSNGLSASMNLPGQDGSYATTPTFPIQTTSFTIAFWVNLYDPTVESYIYSYWSNPHIFQVRVSSQGKIVMSAYKNQSPNEALFHLFAGKVFSNQWTHVATTLNRAKKQVKLYQDGVEVGQETTTHSVIDLRSPIRSVFDIGLKRDSFEVIKGYLRELVAFDRALTSQEVKYLKDETDFRSKYKLWIGSPEKNYNNWVPNLSSNSGCASARAWGQYQWVKVHCNVTMEFICKKTVLIG